MHELMDWFNQMIEHINALICCTIEIQFWSQVQSFVHARFCFGRGGEKGKLLLQLQKRDYKQMCPLTTKLTNCAGGWEAIEVRVCCVPGHQTKLYPHKLVLEVADDDDDPRHHSCGNTSSELSSWFFCTSRWISYWLEKLVVKSHCSQIKINEYKEVRFMSVVLKLQWLLVMVEK